MVDQHAVQHGAPERLGRGGAARHRDPAGRRPRPRARGRGPGRDPDQGRQPLQRLLARRLRRPRRRRLVVHGRRRLPRRRRRPLPRRPDQGPDHRLRLQRLPERDRGRRPQRPRGHRGGRHRRPRRRHRGGRRRLRRRPRRRSRDRRRRRPPALRDPAGQVQAAEPDRGRRRAAADRHRQGPEGPPARPRAPTGTGPPGMTVTRVTLYSRPGCHLCDEARARHRAGLRRPRRVLRRGRHRHRPGAARPLHRRGPGDLRRRSPARLLAGRRGPAAGRPHRADRPRVAGGASHMC